MQTRCPQGIVLLLAVLSLLGCIQKTRLEQQSPETLSDQPFIQTSPQPTAPDKFPLKELDEVLPLPSEEAVAEKRFFHTVRWPGETLHRISWWYTGTGQNWPEIVKANKGLDPRKMRIGEKIIIPAHLLQRQVPMTREYRTPVAVSRELEALALPAPASTLQTVDLFGPIDSAVGNTAVEESDTLPLESLE